MRTYPTNSPQAAARIVAMAVLADGHICKSELDSLDRLDVAELLGVEPEVWQSVVHGVCDDLLSTSNPMWTMATQVDDATQLKVLSEIDDPELRHRVFQLCEEIIASDARVDVAEARLLASAAAHWNLTEGGASALR